MAARFRITIKGLPELRERFSIEHFREVMIRALPEAFEPARSAIQAAAPRGKTGKLSRRIVTKVGARRGSSLSVTIRSGAGYASLVETGHRLVAGGKISRAHTLGGHIHEALSGRFKGRVVGHVPPHPFAEPAFRTTEAAVTAILERRLVEALGAP